MDALALEHMNPGSPTLALLQSGYECGNGESVVPAQDSQDDADYDDDAAADDASADDVPDYTLTEHDCMTANADIIMKTIMMSSVVARLSSVQKANAESGKSVCEDFNASVSRMAFTSGDWVVTRDDVNAFRNMLHACAQVSEHAVRNPVVQEGDQTCCTLGVSIVDFLRTACFIQGNGRKEYSRSTRSAESQAGRNVCKALNNRQPFALEAYATGDCMNNNFMTGLENVKTIASKDDKYLSEMITSAKPSIMCSLTSFMLPSVMDCRRVKASILIASRFFSGPADDPETVFGSTQLLTTIFGSSSTLLSVDRSLRTICAIFAMARLNFQKQAVIKFTEEGMEPVTAKEAANRFIKDMPAWVEMKDLLRLLSEDLNELLSNSAANTTGTNALIYRHIADWFEGAVKRSHGISVLCAAFSYEGFCTGRMHSLMETLWTDFKQRTDIPPNSSCSLWCAADFLISARLQLHDELPGSNILTSAMVVFSGAIGKFIHNDIDGPFNFDKRLKKEATRLMRLFPLAIPRKAWYHYKPAIHVDGKRVYDTKITTRILKFGRVRTQNNKSNVTDGRLAACFFMMSYQADVLTDLETEVPGVPNCKYGVSSKVLEGRKDARRIYIIALQTLPCVNYSSMRKQWASPLIERSRSDPTKDTTTGDNTEKPMRDVTGGAVFGTIFYPVAAKAFVSALDEILKQHRVDESDYKFSSTSNVCMREFTKSVLSWSDTIFDPTLLVDEGGGPVRLGTEESKLILNQQKSVFHNVCCVVKDNGTIWEALQLVFSIQDPRENKTEGFEEAGSHSLNDDDDFEDDSDDDFPDERESNPSKRQRIK